MKDKLKNALISRKKDLENINPETYYYIILVVLILSLFVSVFMIFIYDKTRGAMLFSVALSLGIFIFLITFFILLIPLIFILSSRHKKKQKIIYFLQNLTNNWQE
ncbi:hypothetical protein QUB06_33575 [Microcoleus sp. D2_18a_D3]